MSSCGIPPAYLLALERRDSLEEVFGTVANRITCAGKSSSLLEFLAFVQHGRASINMSLPRCVRFLETGAWKNIYEATACESEAPTTAMNDLVAAKLGPWFERRQKFERLLRFGPDTHYTALNLNGPGPTRYGICCVVLEAKQPYEYSTCFGGDSLRTVFDSNGAQVLDDEEILSLFAIRESSHILAAARHLRLIETSRPGIDPVEIRGVLETSDSLIEIHLHGPVMRSHIDAVVLTRQNRNHLWDLALRSRDMAPPLPQEFDMVSFFLRLVQLLDQYRIPLRLAEDV